MNKGISVYLGLDTTLEENLLLLRKAAARDIRRIFTSLHIPEADYRRVKAELAPFLKEARALNLDIIGDISPQTLELLDLPALDFAAFAALGITTLRLDYGYSAAQIASFTRNTAGLRIQINASTLHQKFIASLQREHADLSRLDALHNFYPRRGTGLDAAFFNEKNAVLAAHGIAVGAFIPCRRRRSPLKEGLPTLEAHRMLDTGLAARHLAALGVNSIFIGDAPPSCDELDSLAAVAADRVDIRARLLTKDPAVADFLRQTFTSRADEARDAVRAQESRAQCKTRRLIIRPAHTVERAVNAVTLDNERYGRYMGELQIIKRTQCTDPRVNVAAEIFPEESFLLHCIKPAQKFSLLLEALPPDRKKPNTSR